MLPLFLLSIILFPESVIQLHVFEPKYKSLINDCLADNKVFGVQPVISGKMKNIGCTAKIVEVLNRYPNGNTDILVRGMKKYELKHSALSPHQYLLGDVEYIDDDFEYPDTSLLKECISLFNKIAEEVKSLRLEKVDADFFYSVTPSYFFAEKAGLTNEQKYYLLQQKSENVRLKFLADHLKDVEPMLRQAETIQRLIKNDGYGKRF